MLASEDIHDILKQFPPITFAFAYGSGVISQGSYDYKKLGSDLPMIDLVFAVDDSVDWHAKNMKLNPSHYTPFMPLSPQMVATVQEQLGAKVWFNTLLPSHIGNSPNRLMKYGVISKKDLIDDLEHWTCLYCSGRLQKPVQIIKGSGHVEQAIEVSKESAIVTSLLLLQKQFTEKDLYCTIASLSYFGDPRMIFGENPKKVLFVSIFLSSFTATGKIFCCLLRFKTS